MSGLSIGRVTDLGVILCDSLYAACAARRAEHVSMAVFSEPVILSA